MTRWQDVVINGMVIRKWTALTSRVLAVLVRRAEGWCVYLDAVPGIDHQRELEDVVRHGNKMTEAVARAIFTTVPEGVPYVK
jgi:hypothetical protein